MAEDHRHDDLHERLERLEARLHVLEAHLASRGQGEPGPHYYDSGQIHPDLDDQSIAP
jgi:hypothetical protein